MSLNQAEFTHRRENKSFEFAGLLSRVFLVKCIFKGRRFKYTGGTKTRNPHTTNMHISIIQSEIFVFDFYAHEKSNTMQYKYRTPFRHLVREATKRCAVVRHVRAR